MDDARIVWLRRFLGVILVTAGAYAVFDYYRYEQSREHALSEVKDLGGRAYSIGGWPIGTEQLLIFDRPLSVEELERLAIWNQLAKRDYVRVLLHRDLTEAQWEMFRKSLRNCHVYRQQQVP